jgi:hypothetical protein
MAPSTRSQTLGLPTVRCHLGFPGRRRCGIIKRRRSRQMRRCCPNPTTFDNEEDCISQVGYTNESSVETREQGQSSTETEEQSQSPLLQLPGELRNTIYEYALTEKDPISYKNLLGVAILRTNRQIHQEAKNIYHMANTFIIGDDLSEDERWLQRIRREPTQRITYIHAGHNMGIISGLGPTFDLLAQCSDLKLTMEVPVNVLWRLFLSGYLRNLHGFSSITSMRTCKGKGTRTQVHWWKLWQRDLQQVQDHLVSSCPETCTLHAERERLDSNCVVHLHLLHCCSEAHCCTL